MSLPTSYLTSYKNLKDIFGAIQAGQAPKKFTVNFLQSLGFKNVADRLVIGYLKSLGFLEPAGEPTQRYLAFLDQSQGARVLAETIRDAYGDLYQVNTKAHELSNAEIKNKMKTLTQGQLSDAVLDKMAGSFKAVSALADFTGPRPQQAVPEAVAPQAPTPSDEMPSQPIQLGGLVYNIQLVLPDSRDPAVYDALFRSLKEHLLR